MECPDPTQSAGQKLPKGNAGWNHALLKMEGSLGLGDSTAASLAKEFCQKIARHQANERGYHEQSQRRRGKSEQKLSCAFNGQAKEDGSEAAEDAENDRQGEEYLVLTKTKPLKDAKLADIHYSAPPRLRAISSKAKSMPVADSQSRSVSSSISKTSSMVLIRRSELRCRTLSRTLGRICIARA